jgi:myo-inositol-1(or 4)-monophosphatase
VIFVSYLYLDREWNGVLLVVESDFLSEVHEICVECARNAGEYLMRRLSKRDLKINAHSQHDVKLDVDVETEQLIKSIIKRRFPDHGFICEESGRENIQSEYNWVIDPLDGTVNFSKGIPHFCTSIAFKSGPRCLVGVVFDPAKGELFSAIHGIGATLNNKPIQRTPIRRLEEAVIVMGYFKSGSLDEGIRIFEQLTHRVKKMRFFGSAALDLCYLACGRVNAYMQHCLNEWDIAAAALIAELCGVEIEIKEAGSMLNVIGADREIFASFKSIIESEKDKVSD